MRSTGYFLSSLLSMFGVWFVSVASGFGGVATLSLYFSAYLLISSLTLGIPRSFRMSSFLTYHGAFTIVLRILARIVSILFIWLIAAVPHSGIPYVQIGFTIVCRTFMAQIPYHESWLEAKGLRCKILNKNKARPQA